MDIRNDFHILCERFFHLEMEEEEQTEFIRALDLNPDLKSLFESEAAIRALLHEPTVLEDDPDLETNAAALTFLNHALEANSPSQKSGTRDLKEPISINWGTFISAAACILIISTILFSNFKNDTINEIVIAQKPSQDPITPIELNVDSVFIQNYTSYVFNESVPPELENAFILYKNGEYANSFKELSEYTGSRSGNQNSEIEYQRQFGLGLCQLQMNKFEESIHSFQQSALSKSVSVKNASYWYLGLALLKEKKIQEAINALHQIDNKSPYYLKGKKIEEQLK